MSADKEQLLLTFAFETIMAEVTQTKTFSRVAPYIDQVKATWGNSSEDAFDLVTTATGVQRVLYEAWVMVDAMVTQSGPTVELFLERDLINALNGQLNIVVHAKLDVVLTGLLSRGEDDPETLEALARSIEEIPVSVASMCISTVSDRPYYRPVLVDLARKMNVTLKKEEAL